MRKTLGVALVLICSACGSKKKDEPGTGAASATGAGSASATGAGSASGTAAPDDNVALPPVIAADEAGGKKLMDAWLAAQNGGDFAAYSGLYAEKLEGVKRVGARTWRFDRAGWLADRQRMFKHPMVVTAKDIEIRGGTTALTIDFIQGFSQGKFKDEGPKHLVLIKGPSGFQIAREEMLRSDIGGAAANGKASAYLVMEIEKKTYIVIAAGADSSWGKGRIKGPLGGDPYLAMQDASGAPVAAAWASKKLKAFDGGGAACDVTVGALSLVSGGTPHFGTVQGWNNEYDMGDGHVYSEAERARAVFGMGDYYLVGELAVGAGCGTPIVAVDPTAKAEAYKVDNSIDPAAAIAAFRALPAYKSLQEDFADQSGSKDPWESSANADVYVGQGRKLAVVRASEGDGCGEFLGEMTAIFEEKGGKWTLINDPSSDAITVTGIIDSDGDGKFEVIGRPNDFGTATAHFVVDGTSLDPDVAVNFPFNDCGC